MRDRTNSVLVVLAACWLGAVAVRGVDDLSGSEATAAREQWLLGYLKVEQAATAVRDQRLALARQLYTEALALFEGVQRRHPGWNPELVSYRTTHCSEQIGRIDEAVAASIDTMSRPELMAEVRRLRDQRQGADAQAQRLAARAEALQGELDAALAHGREAARLRAELAEATARVSTLQARAEVVAADLKAREADLTRLQAAAGDAAALRSTLADLGRQAESARQWQEKASVAESGQREATARAVDLSVALDRARRETDAVRSERDNLARAAAESKERADAAEQNRRAALAELTAVRAHLDEARQGREEVNARRDDAEARARGAAERAAAAAHEVDDLKVTVANLKAEVQALQPAAVAPLREAHAAALLQVHDLRTATDQMRAERDAARAAEQRLTAEREASLRAARDAAQTADRARAEQKQLEAQAAQTLAAGDRPAAEASLRRLLERNPEDAAIAARLGALLADRGDAAAAEPLLQTARRGQPDDPDIALRLGLVLLRQRKPMAAAAALLPAAEAAPDRADVHHFLGVALVESGWRDGAEKSFRRALELDPRRADTAFCLAALLASAGTSRRAEARACYEQALALGAARDASLDRYFLPQTGDGGR